MGYSNNYTFRLFKRRPTLVGGVASLFDFSNPREVFNLSKTEKEADQESIRADWMAIGKDLKMVMDNYASTEGR